mmetsp:Transcript_35191/g.90048  ORF Transcript_35191/g.90048 Transcript_35191/m.90048 type:complete len:120 (-) Transcript_35191:686-1045(-)
MAEGRAPAAAADAAAVAEGGMWPGVGAAAAARRGCQVPKLGKLLNQRFGVAVLVLGGGSTSSSSRALMVTADTAPPHPSASQTGLATAHSLHRPSRFLCRRQSINGMPLVCHSCVIGIK